MMFLYLSIVAPERELLSNERKGVTHTMFPGHKQNNRQHVTGIRVNTSAREITSRTDRFTTLTFEQQYNTIFKSA